MPAQPLLPGDPRRLGDFMLVGRLGEGGQGIVYLGLAPDGRQVAVKVLKTGADRHARDRLAQEIAAAMRVRPFCTARVLDSSVDADLPYIVSEYVDGPSLQDRVAQRGRLIDGDLDRLIVNTTTALAAIHSARIVHRDLKPANVLLGPDGPRVVDFGISRPADQHTMSGQLIGTPAYFSPEQLRHQPATAASDVFAWAGTMVFSATGHPPFGQDDIATLFAAILRDQPDLTGVPAHMRPILAACLDKNPEQRPTAKDLIAVLLDPEVGVDPGDDVDPGFTEVVRLLDHETELRPPPAGGPGVGGRPDPEPAAEPPPVREAVPEAVRTADRPVDGPADEPRDGPADRPANEPADRPANEPVNGPGEGAPARPSAEPHRRLPPQARANETITPQHSVLETQPGREAERPVGPPPAAFPGSPPADAADAPDAAATPATRHRSRRRLALPAGLALVAALILGALAANRIGGGDGEEVIPAEYGGHWAGSLFQTGGITSSNVKAAVVLEAGRTSGRVEIPSTGCSGDLTLTDVTPAGLRLRLSSGGTDCQSGDVRVHLEDGRLVYDLTGGAQGTAHGKLTPSSPP